MPTSILKALLNIKKYGDNDLEKIIPITSEKQPRINKVGDRLDAYIKDAFCDSFFIKDPKKKKEIYSDSLSHLGGQNNPPDIIIKGGDAIEIKKVEGVKSSTIHLNSSTPKQKIYSNDPMITSNCKNAEKWDKKDLIYAVGNVINKKLKVLIFVYGECYASDKETYNKVRSAMVEGIKKVGLTFAKTKELGRINQVDPLKITDLRIRGMWQIKSPLNVFSKIIKPDLSKNTCVYAIIPESKYSSFEKIEREMVEKQFTNSKIKLESPDKPKKDINVRFIQFSI